MLYVGVQFRGSVAPNATQRWFTFNWHADWDVVWTVVPTSPHPGAPQLEWGVAVERASSSTITYWITIHNLSAQTIDIEARYAILNLGGAGLGAAESVARSLHESERREIEGGKAPELTTENLAYLHEEQHATDAGGPPDSLLQMSE